jgi:hypothetical protein
MAIDFPASPNVGQTVTVGGVTWTWDGTKWVAQGTGVGVYLPLTGGTMTGDIVLKGDPTAALNPVTKQYFDARALNPHDNRLINGDMRIDQRGVASGAGGTASGYTVDRWGCGMNPTGKGTWQRGVGPSVLGFPYCLLFGSASAYASAAGDSFQFYQLIEGDFISDFAWGTSGAKPVTLSFWAYSSISGTFSGSIGNYAGNRSYPFTYSLPAAAWTFITITIPGDTAGTWVMSGNAGAVALHFDLGTGANARGPANAWASANYIGATGAVSVVAVNGANFGVTGVKLEVGSIATPYNRQTLARSLADCQRYFFAGQAVGSWYAATSAAVWSPTFFPVAMRAGPTMAITTNNSSNLTGAPAMGGVLVGASGTNIVGTVAVNGMAAINIQYTASAEL